MKIKFFDKINYIKNHLLRIRLTKKLGYDKTHGYSLIKDSKLLDYFETIKSGDWFIKQAYDYDKFGYMSKELGNELEQQFMDEDYVMGIHRTGHTVMNNEQINNFFTNGLRNFGKVEQGCNESMGYDIENTVSILSKFQYLISQIKSANGYKGSNGCILLKIPKSALGLNDDKPISLYQVINDKSFIKPEFIYGYLPVDYKGNVGELIHNPNYLDNHTLSSNNAVYDKAVINSAKRILFDIYEQTYLKYGKEQASGALVNFLSKSNVNYFTGEKNRELLTNKIDVYNYIKKVNYPNGININDIQNIIDNYESRINKNQNLHGITK